MDFTHYLNSVRLWVSDLTDGVIDLDDLPDLVDIGACYEEMNAQDCAKFILEENGYYDFEFPAEDAGCGYDCEGRPIGG